MSNKIPQIKEELERRFQACSKTTFRGFLVFTQEYTDFIEKITLLTQLIDQIEIKASQINFTKESRYKITFPIVYYIFRKQVKELSELQSIPLLSRIKHEKKLRPMLPFIHTHILGKLSEQELINFKEDKTVLPNEALKPLNLTEKSKWQDIEIIFTNELDIRIKYENKEVKTDHEKMGFIDKRKGNTSKASWKFLQLLSIKDGTIQLDGLENNKREKLKKRKQELSEQLRDFFQINDDPFEKVDKHSRFYKIKFKLTPEPESREDWLDKDIYDE